MAFAELNDWDAESFGLWSRSMNQPFSKFLETPHGFHLGIASAHAMEDIHLVSGGVFHHGVLLVFCM